MELYSNHVKHYVAVDCVILGYKDDKLCLLMYPRGFEPSKGSWSLMGGFVQDKESSDTAARRVLKRTTGLDNIYLQQVGTFSDPNRESVARVISIGYSALVRIDDHDINCARESGAHWWPVTDLPDMIFDHRDIVEKALFKLKQEAGGRLIGRELLPDIFTLLHLRRLYEAIFMRELDAGNFRKKVLSLGLLNRTDKKDPSESKKGSYYYNFKDGVDAEKGIGTIIKF